MYSPLPLCIPASGPTWAQDSTGRGGSSPRQAVLPRPLSPIPMPSGWAYDGVRLCKLGPPVWTVTEKLRHKGREDVTKAF